MDYISEHIKILIGACTALILVSVTFLDRIAEPDRLILFIAFLAWACGVTSIWQGSLAMLKLSYVEDAKEVDDDGIDPEYTVHNKELTRNLVNQRYLALISFSLLAAMALIGSSRAVFNV